MSNSNKGNITNIDRNVLLCLVDNLLLLLSIISSIKCLTNLWHPGIEKPIISSASLPINSGDFQLPEYFKQVPLPINFKPHITFYPSKMVTLTC